MKNKIPADHHPVFRYLFIVICFSVILSACQIGPLIDPTPSPPPPTATSPPLPTATPDPYTSAGYDLFIAQLDASLRRDRPVLVNRYLANLPEAPLTDGNRAMFFWRGSAFDSVQVAGDMNNWDPAGGPALRHIDGTDLWVGEATFETNARLDYKFLIDGADLVLDPLNPRTMLGSFGPNSELAMPDYRLPPELEPPPAPVPTGTMTEHTLDSAALNQTRTFFVYAPAGQIIGEKLPSVYIHDGGEYLNLIDAPAILDRLIADGEIPPLVAVFIPPFDRSGEYDRNEAYVQFLADELVPFIVGTYDTDPDPAKTGNLGSSLGGLLAVYAGLYRPDTFGLAGGYSGAYGRDNDAVIQMVGRPGTEAVRFYLNVGTYETAVNGDPDSGNLLAANQRLVEALQNEAYDFAYTEAPQGHSWGLWRDYLGAGLRFLYGR